MAGQVLTVHTNEEDPFTEFHVPAGRVRRLSPAQEILASSRHDARKVGGLRLEAV